MHRTAHTTPHAHCAAAHARRTPRLRAAPVRHTPRPVCPYAVRNAARSAPCVPCVPRVPCAPCAPCGMRSTPHSVHRALCLAPRAQCTVRPMPRAPRGSRPVRCAPCAVRSTARPVRCVPLPMRAPCAPMRPMCPMHFMRRMHSMCPMLPMRYAQHATNFKTKTMQITIRKRHPSSNNSPQSDQTGNSFA